MNIGDWQISYDFEVQKTELSLQDLPVNFDQITELKDSKSFKLGQIGSRRFVMRKELL